ncbi:MAG: tetratricopeptide repeat protein [Myxococcota bacterium]
MNAKKLVLGLGALILGACGGSTKNVPVETGPKVVRIKPREVVAKANTQIENKEYAAAVEKLDGLLEKQPSNDVARYNRGYAHQQLGNWREAESDYRQVLANDPEDVQTTVNLGAVLRAQARTDEAAKIYEALLEKKPFQAELLNNLSVLHRERKDYDSAIGAVRKLLMRDKENVDAYKNLALVYLDQDKLKLAETILQNARRMSEEQKRSDPDIFVNLGRIYLQREENGRAMAAFKKALDYDPDHVSANANIGALALRHRDYGLARTSYDKVAAKRPTDPEVESYLAYALQGAQEHEVAVEHFEKARTLYSKAGRSEPEQLLLQLVITLQNANQNEKALKTADEYLARTKKSCGEDDYDGFCGRYNGIKLTLEMAEEALAEEPEEESGVQATGRDIFTEEDAPEGEVLDGEGEEGGAADGEDPDAAPEAEPEAGEVAES